LEFLAFLILDRVDAETYSRYQDDSGVNAWIAALIPGTSGDCWIRQKKRIRKCEIRENSWQEESHDWQNVIQP
jgi:hypothetical protein